MKRKTKQKPKTIRTSAWVELGEVTIANPWFNPEHNENASNPRRYRAIANVRESPVMWMYAHGNLELHQLEAATIVRKLHEQRGIGSVRAIDPARECVDGGRMSIDITDRQKRAGEELDRIKAVLGADDYELVINVCGWCIWLKDLEAKKRKRSTLSERLRLCLDAVAIEYNLASKRKKNSRG